MREAIEAFVMAALLALPLLLTVSGGCAEKPQEPAVCPYCEGTGILWAHVGEKELSFLGPDYPTASLLIPDKCGWAHWLQVDCTCQGVRTFSPPYGRRESAS